MILKDLKWTIRHSLLPCQTVNDSPLDISNSILILNFVQESLYQDRGILPRYQKRFEILGSPRIKLIPEKFWRNLFFFHATFDCIKTLAVTFE